MLEFNVAVRFPAAPLLTVILALVGKLSIMLNAKNCCCFFDCIASAHYDIF